MRTKETRVRKASSDDRESGLAKVPRFRVFSSGRPVRILRIGTSSFLRGPPGVALRVVKTKVGKCYLAFGLSKSQGGLRRPSAAAGRGACIFEVNQTQGVLRHG